MAKHRFIMSKWLKNYELAKKYYEYYGNLDVDRNFKTNDGITYDKEGFCLGEWIAKCRGLYVKELLTKEQIKLLNEIDMIWSYYSDAWDDAYEYALKYFEYYDNLNVPIKFKTNDGITYDKDGFKLGAWIHAQRKAYKGIGTGRLTNEQIERLNKIKMIWDAHEYNWNFMYDLSTKYYNYYGDLDVPINFKTKDGINYDEDGYSLYGWIISQRAYKIENKLSKSRIKKLDKLKMKWNAFEDNWMIMYNLCVANFNYYGKLNIPARFKTKDGITYDENGYNLGAWLSTQKKAYKGTYKTTDINRIHMLDALNIIWFSENIDLKLQMEEFNIENIDRKKIEILNRTLTTINRFNKNILPSKEEINKTLILQLERKL